MENNSLMEIVHKIFVLSWLYMACTQIPSEGLEDISYNGYFIIGPSEQPFYTEDYESRELQARALESDVSYHFYSENHKEGVALPYTNVEVLNSTDFSTYKETVFIMHGWRGFLDSRFNYNIRVAFLGKHNVNLFVVDWSPIAKRNYFTAQRAVQQVGTFVAIFIRKLMMTYDLQLSKVVFVGHSLGAHVAGNTGAALDGQVRYIVGLDPASPLFYRLKLTNRLDPDDAKYVQAIHTNGGYLGVLHPVGHSDFYPNGGSSQPGCGIDLLGFCAHRRAWAFYAESVSAEADRFMARQCVSYNAFLSGQCIHNPVSLMAGYPIDTNASGKYYLTTNKNPPYARG